MKNKKNIRATIQSENTIWQFMLRFVNIYHKVRSAIIYKPHFSSFGAKSTIRNPLFIANPKYISIGNGVSIRDGARLEIVKLVGRTPSLSIGDRTLIEQNCHITCSNKITIEEDVAIAAMCSIVDIRHPSFAEMNGVNIGRGILLSDESVKIEKGAFLGVGVTVLPGVTIGRGAVIGAHSVVSRDIAPFAIAVGCPAKQIN